MHKTPRGWQLPSERGWDYSGCDLISPEPSAIALISKTSFSLLAELAENNTKSWYDARKDFIKAHCLTPFGEMLEHVSNRLVDSAYPLEGSAKSMLRMYRNVRFSKNKTPYKTNVSGMLTPDGSKGDGAGMVFLFK